MTPEKFQSLQSGDKVLITPLKFLPNMSGRVAFRVNETQAYVRYFDTTGAAQTVLCYINELELP
jgi:hypothetical protein